MNSKGRMLIALDWARPDPLPVTVRQRQGYYLIRAYAEAARACTD